MCHCVSRLDARFVACTAMILLTLTCVLSKPKEDQYGGKQKQNKPWWEAIVKPLRTLESVQSLIIGNPNGSGRQGKNEIPRGPKSTTRPPKKSSVWTMRPTTPTTVTPSTKATTATTATAATLTVGNPLSPKARKNLELLEKEQCGMSLEPKIINGNDTMPGEFPWLALLQVKDLYNGGGLKFVCGGSLINPRYVLTAAHCVRDFRFKLVSVRLGEYDTEDESNKEGCSDQDLLMMDIFQKEICLAESSEDYEVDSFLVHQNYSRSGELPNDIALIKLKRTVRITRFITPVCMPVGDLLLSMGDFKTGTIVTVAGWGMTEKLGNSPTPLKASLPLMEFRSCTEMIPDMPNGKLCIGDDKGGSPCFGDSGGPLILRKMMIPFQESNDVEDNIYAGWTMSVLVGVVSYGRGICNVIMPTVATSIQDYLPWILENMEPWKV